jgi:DNA-binding transcriptional LysR family regulator
VGSSTPPAGSERWSALEIRLLVAFVAVVDEGSFTAAAKRLGYTQSGISQQIATLERIVDRKLLERQSGGHRPIEPTPDGISLLRHSRIILGQLDRAYAEVMSQAAAVAATVSVACYPNTAVLVPPIERVLQEQTGLRLELHESLGDDEVIDLVESRQAEIAFAGLPVPTHFASEELGSDPYVVVVPADSPLAHKQEVTLDQLAGEPLLGARLSPYEEAIEARLAAAGLDTAAFRRYDDNRLIQAHVRSGNGIALVPSLSIVTTDERVRVLRLRASLPARVIALVHLRDALLSPAAREFKELAVPLCRQILASTPFAWEYAAAS